MLAPKLVTGCILMGEIYGGQFFSYVHPQSLGEDLKFFF